MREPILRIIRTIIFVFLISSTFATYSQKEFLNALGTEKAQSFQTLMDSYRNFLTLNYPKASTLGEQTRAFMMQMVNGEPPPYDSISAIDVITALEQTGLRKDICLYSDEVYEPTYNLRQFLTEEQADEIDENIALNNRKIIVNDSLKQKWDSIFQAEFERLSPEQRKKEEEIQKMREEGRMWGSTPTPKGLFHYALLKTDTLFYAYCLLRSFKIHPAITSAMTELSNDELESWNVQVIFMVDYYLGDILFRYRRHLIQPTAND